ncbi:hypothetical protein PAXRUDRAFT_822306 [Paxillus rubicundulus Ve08.2h10]|uniref:Uncharacterized protein n=1 Tax=Paxillus rubicundulus Ve08.2h10 TaxID=930991 RepID=A0A0D0DMC3_9AGAM|nr:hypothetical protein PAXRUDRAFT_822306 [Paxillus rubicundulus Ve08.2h10]
MRSFCIFVFALFLVALTAALPLQLRVTRPGLVHVLGGLIADSGRLSVTEGPEATSGCQTHPGHNTPGHTAEEISLESIVKSIRPVQHFKGTYAEVTVYVQELPPRDR